MKFCKIFVFLFFLPSTYLISQDEFLIPSDAEVDSLVLVAEDIFKDDLEEIDAVSIWSETSYSFEMADEDAIDPVVAIKSEYDVFTSLEDKIYVYQYENTDNKSQIFKSKAFIGQSATIAYDRSEFTKSYDMNSRCYNNYSESIFSSDLSQCVFSCYLKNKNSIGATEIKKKYTDVKYLTTVSFFGYRPTLKKKIKFVVPEWLDIEFHEMNFDAFDIHKTIDEEEIDGVCYYTHSYYVENMGAYVDEEYRPGFTHFSPHIAVVCKSYKTEDREGVLFEETSDLYNWYNGLVKSCDNDVDAIKDFTLELTKDSKTDKEKIEKIYYWIQDNIRYVAFEDGIMGFKPESVQKVYGNKYGDCKGMANLAKNMLDVIGIDARHTWIGTTHISKEYDYSFPSLANDNHMICTVFHEGETYFIDPTETFIGLGDCAERIQGKYAMIADGDNYIIEKVPEYDYKRNKIEYKRNLRIEKGLLKGNTKLEYNGNEKTYMMNQIAYLESGIQAKLMKRFLEDKDKNVDVSTYIMSDLEDRMSPLVFEFNWLMRNAIVTSGNEIYLSLEFDKDFNGFKIEKPRKTDIELSNRVYRVCENKLQMPDGYKAKYLPEDLLIKGVGYTFLGSYQVEGSDVHYKRELIIEEGIIKKSEIENWNTDLKKINEFYNEQIILEK